MIIQYGTLFEPFYIGHMKLKNRVVVSPMDFKFFYGDTEDSTISKRVVDVLKARAKGGAGLVITSQVKAEREFDPFPKSLDFPAIDKRERIKEFAELADSIHLYGAKVLAELGAGGGRYADIVEDGDVVYSASAVPTQYNPEIITRPATRKEIDYLIESYGRAAGRLKQAGFDGICAMCGTGYVIAQFLSPAWNHRKDEYGGSLENNMRFLVECLQSAKRHAGDDFAIVLNITLDERLGNINMGVLTTGETSESSSPDVAKIGEGITLDYAIEVAQRLEAMNLVDGYHCRIGNYYDQETIIPSAYSTNEEYMADIIEFHKHVTKPVIFDNKLSDPVEMQNLIDEGATDMVSMGRGWIAEPSWVVKAQTKPDTIRPCIRCMMCLDMLWHDRYCQCAVNPQFGHEGEKLTRIVDDRKVLIVGGGPAGVTAALTAKERGFDVLLVERRDKLGGRIPEAGGVDFKPEIRKYAKWMRSEVERQGIHVEFNFEANAEWCLQQNADVIIIATGADTVKPDIAGGDKAILAEDVLLDRVNVGEKAVVLGGGLAGCEAAFKLQEMGTADVTVVAARDDILKNASVVYRHTAVKKVHDAGINVRTNTKVVEVSDRGVVTSEGETIACDTVVWAKGERADSSLFDELNAQIVDVYRIGDNLAPRKIFNAVQEAYRLVADL